MSSRAVRRCANGAAAVAAARDWFHKLGPPKAFADHLFVRKLVGSVLTQVLLSATNFLIGLYLIRAAAKEEYGLYVLCFSVIQIFNSLQNAVVNTPLTVILPGKEEAQRGAFLSGLAVGQWFLIIPTLAACGVGFLAWAHLKPVAPVHLGAAMALLLAVPASCLREYLRVLLYLALNVRSVFFADLAFVGSIMAVLFVAGISRQVTAGTVILAIGAAGLASSACAHRLSGRRYRVHAPWIRAAFRETWPYSRWALLGVAVTNVQSFAYIFIITSLMGLGETADVSAARMFFMPFGLLLGSCQRIFLAKGAHLLNESRDRFQQLTKGFIGLFALLWALYFLVVLVSHEFVLLRVFTAEYGRIGHLILGWGVFFLLQSVSFSLNHALQVLKDFRMLSILGSLSASVTLVFCFWLTRTFGLMGGLLALVLGEATAVAGYALRVRRMNRTQPAPA